MNSQEKLEGQALLDHQRLLLHEARRRLRVLEIQRTQEGYQVRPHIITEIESLEAEIKRYESNIDDSTKFNHENLNKRVLILHRPIILRFTLLIIGLTSFILFVIGLMLWLRKPSCLPDNKLTYSNYITQGRAHVNENFDCALNYFNAAINLDPDEWGAYWERGFLYKKHNHPDLAIQDFNQAIALSDRSEQSGSYYYLGLIYRDDKKEYIKSIDYFTNAINIQSGYAIAYCDRAYTYELQEELNLAIEDYRLCLNFATNGDHEYDRATKSLNRLEVQP